MQEEYNENDNSLNIEEEIQVEDETKEETQVDETETLKQEIERLKATNQKLYARVKKAPLSKGVNPKDEFVQRISNLELIEKKRQFGYEYGLSPAETDAIFKVNPNPTKDDLENPFIKGGIDALRRKNRVEENTPHPSISTVKIDGKTLSEMTPEERASNWDKIKQSIKK